jgi:hypothetical protein
MAIGVAAGHVAGRIPATPEGVALARIQVARHQAERPRLERQRDLSPSNSAPRSSINATW